MISMAKGSDVLRKQKMQVLLSLRQQRPYYPCVCLFFAYKKAVVYWEV